MKLTKTISLFLIVLISLVSVLAAVDVSITPRTAYDSDNLNCNPNSNQFVYKWFRNGALHSNTAPVLNAAFTAAGDVWKCEAWKTASTNTIIVGGRPVVINNPAALQGSAQVTIRADPIPNNAPVANANGPYTVDEGQNFTYTDASTDADGTIVSWLWDFGDLTNSTLQNPDHIYLANGTYNLTLTVTDDDGATDVDATTVTVNDLAPVVDFNASAWTVNEGDTVDFTDLTTFVVDTIASWSWDFGDGNTDTVQNPSNTYQENGTYTVTLTATDSDGSVNSTTHTIDVANVAPTADAGTSYACNEGTTVNLTGTATDPGVLDVLTYDWDLDNNLVYETLGVQNPTFNCTANGTYTVNLQVTDDDLDNGTSSATVTVADLAPVANFVASSYNVTVGDTVNFTDLSTYTVDAITNWNWDFGDSNTDNVANTSNIYTAEGNYTVNLTITDSDGSTASIVQNVIVNNATAVNNLPVLNAIGNQTVNENQTLTITLNATDLDPLDVLTYGTDATVGSLVGNVFTWTPTYTESGNYTVMFNVTDGTDVDSETINIEVIDVTIPIHDVAVRYTYGGSVNTGIRINDSVGDILDIPANLTQGTAYTIRYYIDNQGTQPEDINVSVYAGATLLDSYVVTGINSYDAGRIDFNAATLALGAQDITLNATIVGYTDSDLTDNDASRAINVIAAPNTAPNATITSPLNGSSNVQGTSIDFNGTAIDAEDGNLTGASLAWTSSIDGALGIGETFSLTNLSIGNHTITLTATDSGLLTDVETVSVEVTSTPGNNAPVLNAIGNQTVNENQTLTITLNATDLDPLDVLTYGTDATVGSLVGNVFTFTPDFTQAGNYTVMFNVTDGTDVDSETINIEVIDVTIPAYNILNSTINGVLYPQNTSAQVTSPTINAATNITDSTVTVTNFITDSLLQNALVTNTASMLRCTVIDSEYDGSTWGADCVDAYIDPSTVRNSNVTGARVRDSTVIDSIVPYTNVTNSNLSNVNLSGDVVTDSNLTNLVGNGVITITGSSLTSSNLTDSTVTSSTINNAVVTNSTITNTTIQNMQLVDAVVNNGNILSGNITISGTTYTVSSSTPLNYYPPQNPTISINTVYNVNRHVIITLNVNDPNGIGQITNCDVDFGDGIGISTGISCSGIKEYDYAANGAFTITARVHSFEADNTTRTVQDTEPVSVSVSTGGGSTSHGGGGGGYSTTQLLPQETVMAAHTYTWDSNKESSYTGTIRAIDSIMFVYQGTAYSLLVDSIREDGAIKLKISPTDEKEAGFKGDTLNFDIKDKSINVLILDSAFNKLVDSQSTVKIKISLSEGTKKTETKIIDIPKIQEKVKDGVIKVMGEITPPADTSLPIGIGVSAATFVVGLLLFLGVRKIWV